MNESTSWTISSCPEELDKLTGTLNESTQNDCIQIIINHLTSTLYHQLQTMYIYYGSTVLVIPAIIFNIISLSVLYRLKLRHKKSKGTSTNIYMIYLCITDTLTLVAKFLNEFLIVRNALRSNPYELNSFICKAIFFGESLFSTISIYLIVAMTFDKLICVIVPLHSGIILTRRRARLVCTVVTLGGIAMASYHIIDQHHENTICEETSLSNRMKLLDNLIKVFIPFLLILSFNVALAAALVKKRRKGSFDKEALTIHNSKVPQRKENFIFIMIFTVSCVFLLLNLPYALISIYGLMNGLYLQIDDTILTKSKIISITKFETWLNLSLFLLDLTHVVNFFLYFFSGSKFRHELFELLKFKRVVTKRLSATTISSRKTSSSDC